MLFLFGILRTLRLKLFTEFDSLQHRLRHRLRQINERKASSCHLSSVTMELWIGARFSTLYSSLPYIFIGRIWPNYYWTVSKFSHTSDVWNQRINQLYVQETKTRNSFQFCTQTKEESNWLNANLNNESTFFFRRWKMFRLFNLNVERYQRNFFFNFL